MPVGKSPEYRTTPIDMAKSAALRVRRQHRQAAQERNRADVAQRLSSAYQAVVSLLVDATEVASLITMLRDEYDA